MLTREQYLAGDVTHDQYYQQFVSQRIIGWVVDLFGSVRLREAFASDEHFNTLPLRRWDALTTLIEQSVRPLLQEAGDGWSLAGGVCILKSAAKIHVLGEAPEGERETV